MRAPARYVHLRNNHVVEKIRPGSAIEKGTERPWRPARGEIFTWPLRKHPLEGDLEWRGRVHAVSRERQAGPMEGGEAKL